MTDAWMELCPACDAHRAAMLTDVGPVEIKVPRDASGTFKPQIIKKPARGAAALVVEHRAQERAGTRRPTGTASQRRLPDEPDAGRLRLP
ncbi:transposase [Streptomyces sp. NPDC060006]|uniref:transposase n=1 Tax=unclassified Streptomyces TaxID=2593676 RepID=UPI00367E5B55